jgi:Ran-binding protein 9/10
VVPAFRRLAGNLPLFSFVPIFRTISAAVHLARALQSPSQHPHPSRQLLATTRPSRSKGARFMRQRKRRKTMRPPSAKPSLLATPPALCVNGVCTAHPARHPAPSAMSASDCAAHLSCVDAGLAVVYNGPGKDEKDAASVRADVPIPTSGLALYYFEVTVVHAGETGRIGIGLCDGDVGLNKMPGWSKGSFGYHGDDGCLFRQTGVAGEKYSSKYGGGDVVGCCWDLVDDVVFFTKNGVALGTAFQHLVGPLFPTVGMQTKSGRVSVNFGASPFLFDVDSYARSQRDRVVGNVLAVSLPENDQFVADTVLAYMINAGFAKTAEAFAKESGRALSGSNDGEQVIASQLLPLGKKPSTGLSLQGVRERQLVLAKVMEGQTENALAHARKMFPGLEVADPETQFLVKTQEFIEMLLSGKAALAAVQYARQELMPFHEVFPEQLEEVYSLLVYENVAESPVAHLVQVGRRERVACSLNEAMLESQNQPAHSILERILAQSHAVLDLHADTANGPAAMIAVDTVLSSRL